MIIFFPFLDGSGLIIFEIFLKGKFVAAFASANLGDVSPNLKGPKCIDTGLDCDMVKKWIVYVGF